MGDCGSVCFCSHQQVFDKLFLNRDILRGETRVLRDTCQVILEDFRAAERIIFARDALIAFFFFRTGASPCILVLITDTEQLSIIELLYLAFLLTKDSTTFVRMFFQNMFHWSTNKLNECWSLALGMYFTSMRSFVGSGYAVLVDEWFTAAVDVLNVRMLYNCTMYQSVTSAALRRRHQQEAAPLLAWPRLARSLSDLNHCRVEDGWLTAAISQHVSPSSQTATPPAPVTPLPRHRLWLWLLFVTTWHMPSLQAVDLWVITLWLFRLPSLLSPPSFPQWKWNGKSSEPTQPDSVVSFYTGGLSRALCRRNLRNMQQFMLRTWDCGVPQISNGLHRETAADMM